MKRYVDGYVLPVKKDKINEYKKMATLGAKIWIKHGALQYYECVGEDMSSVKQWGGLSFPKMMNLKKGYVPVFSYIVFKSKSHRDKVNAMVMKDKMMNDPKLKDKPMPFELKTMAYGGFESLVAMEKRN